MLFSSPLRGCTTLTLSSGAPCPYGIISNFPQMPVHSLGVLAPEVNKTGLASPAQASEPSSLTSIASWRPGYVWYFLRVQRKGQDSIFHAGVQACRGFVSCTSPSNQRGFKSFPPANLAGVVQGQARPHPYHCVGAGSKSFGTTLWGPGYRA